MIDMVERGESLERVQRKGRILKRLTEGMQVCEKIIVREPKGRHYTALYTAHQALVRSGRSVMIRVEEGNRLGIY